MSFEDQQRPSKSNLILDELNNESFMHHSNAAAEVAAAVTAPTATVAGDEAQEMQPIQTTSTKAAPSTATTTSATPPQQEHTEESNRPLLQQDESSEGCSSPSPSFFHHRAEPTEDDVVLLEPIIEVAIARVVDRFRFKIPSRMLDERVTSESLLRIANDVECLGEDTVEDLVALAGRLKRSSPPKKQGKEGEQHQQQQEQTSATATSSSRPATSRGVTRLRRHVTYADLLQCKYVSDAFPLTTIAERNLLRELSTRTLVTKAAVVQSLRFLALHEEEEKRRQAVREKKRYQSGPVDLAAAAAAAAAAASASAASAGAFEASSVNKKTQRRHDKLVNSIFYGDGQESVPGFVLSHVAEALGKHPNIRHFAESCPKRIVDLKTNLAFAVPQLIVLIVSILILPSLGIQELFFSHHSAWFPTMAQWPNRCPDGVMEPTCILYKMDLDYVRVRSDIVDFFRKELIEQLWPNKKLGPAAGAVAVNNKHQIGKQNNNSNNGTSSSSGGEPVASEVPYYGSYFVGALLMKSSPADSAQGHAATHTPNIKSDTLAAGFVAPTAVCPVRSCSSLNLTRGTYEVELDESFSCSAFLDSGVAGEAATTIIPFRTTKQQAFDIAANFTPRFCDSIATQTTAHFTLYDPSNGILTLAVVSATVPQVGFVVPRTLVYSFRLDTANKVLALLIVQAAGLAWVLLLVLFNFRSRRGALSGGNILSIVLRCILLVLLGLVYGILFMYMPSESFLQQAVIQDQFIPPQIDVITSWYGTALDVLAIWGMALILPNVLAFRSFIGFSIVLKLLQVVATDVTVLLVVFGVVEVAFIGVARVLFGSVVSEMSTTPMASMMLVNFWWGDADYGTIIEQMPFLGVVFFLCYLVWVGMFALNLLVTIILDPLSNVQEAYNLHLELESNVNSDARNFLQGEETFFGLRCRILRIVNIFIDMVPAPFPLATKWIELEAITARLFHSAGTRDSAPTLGEVIKAALALIELCERAVLEQKKQVVVNKEEEQNNNGGATKLEPVYPAWNTALARGMERYQEETIPNTFSCTLVRLFLRQYSTSDLIRDAVLMRMLLSYDEVSTRFSSLNMDALTESRVIQHHETKKKQNGSPLGGGGGGGGGGNGGSEDDDTDTDDGCDDDEVTKKTTDADTVGHQHQQQQQQQQLAGGVSSRSLLSNNNASFSSSNNNPSAAPHDFAEMLLNNMSLTMSNADAVRVPLAGGRQFCFAAFVRAQVERQRFWPILSIVTLTLYLLFIIPVLHFREPFAWLGENLNAALRETQWITTCEDERCTKGFTGTKFFDDITRLYDTREYIDRLLVPQLFPTEKEIPFNIPKKFRKDQRSNVSFPVFFDEHIRILRHEPVSVRQIRDTRKPCPPSVNPSKEMLNDHRDRGMLTQTRADMITNFKCYERESSHVFLEKPKNFSSYYNNNNGGVTSNTSSSPQQTPSSLSYLLPFPPEAYEFRETCESGQPVKGSFRWYPCEGFTAQVHNRSQMLAIKSWIDEATQLVVFSVPVAFSYRDVIETGASKTAKFRLDLFVEFGRGGAVADVWSYISPFERSIFSLSFPGFGLLAFDFLNFVVHSIYVAKLRECEGDAARMSHMLPEIPTTSVVALAFIVVQYMIDNPEYLHHSLTLTALIFHSTALLLRLVILPLAKLLSRRSEKLIRTLELSMWGVGTVIPYYILFFVAFALSAYIGFGRAVMTFGTMSTTATAIGKGMFEDWDFDELYEQRPRAAVAFTITFIAVVVFVLANLLLVLVQNAGSEATLEGITLCIHQLSGFLNEKLWCGEGFASYLSFFVRRHDNLAAFAADGGGDGGGRGGGNSSSSHHKNGGGGGGGGSSSLFSEQQHNDDDGNNESFTQRHQSRHHEVSEQLLSRMTITEHGRVVLPAETLTALCPPCCLIEVAEVMHLGQIPQSQFLSTVLYVAHLDAVFRKNFRDQLCYDEMRERSIYQVERRFQSVPVKPREKDKDREDEWEEI